MQQHQQQPEQRGEAAEDDGASDPAGTTVTEPEGALSTWQQPGRGTQACLLAMNGFRLLAGVVEPVLKRLVLAQVGIENWK